MEKERVYGAAATTRAHNRLVLGVIWKKHKQICQAKSNKKVRKVIEQSKLEQVNRKKDISVCTYVNTRFAEKWHLQNGGKKREWNRMED